MDLVRGLLFATFLSAGCGTSQSVGDAGASVERSSAELVVRRDWIRNTSAASVCFASGLPAEFRDSVRTAVGETWEDETGFTFTGWSTCPVFPSPGTIIVKTVGNPSHGVSNEVQLVSTPCPPAPLVPPGFCATRSEVLHQFGHAMGFLEEGARANGVAGQCPSSVDPYSVALGAFDSSSVMNDCASNSSLSRNDIAFSGLSYGWPRSVTATSWGAGRIDAFIQETDGLSLWHFWSGDDGASWGSEQFYDGTLTSAPVATSRGSGKLDLFGRGFDGRIYWKQYLPGHGWTAWAQMLVSSTGVEPGVITGSLAVAAIDSQRVAIVGRRQGPQSGPAFGPAIFVNRVTEPSFFGDPVTALIPISEISAFPVGTPAVAILSNQIHVVSALSDHTLLHYRFNMTGLEFTFALVPNFLTTGSPAMVATNGRLELVAKGLNGDLYATTFDPAGPGAWSAPLFLNGTIRGNPTIASWGPGRIDVFGRGLGDGVFHWSRNATGGFSGPNSQGGSIYGSPTAVSSGSERITVLGTSTVDESMTSQSWLGSSWTSLRSIGGSYLR